MEKTDNSTAQTNIKNSGTVSIKGCEVVLNFLPESNRRTIDTVKKMLISSSPEHQKISSKIA